MAKKQIASRETLVPTKNSKLADREKHRASGLLGQERRLERLRKAAWFTDSDLNFNSLKKG